MKKTTLIVLALLATRQIHAQSLAQDIEQLVLDYQKLATVKHTLSNMYKAYPELRQGFEQIKSIAHGNFNLHKAFLDALLVVNPIVRDYPKVQQIIANEAALVSECQSASKTLAGTGFSPTTLDYFSSQYSSLLTAGLGNINELALVLSDGQLRMNDAERLSAIDQIDRNMTSQLNYLRSFDSRAAILAGQIGIQLNDITTMHDLNGIAH